MPQIPHMLFDVYMFERLHVRTLARLHVNTFARLNVYTLERQNDETCLVHSAWCLVLSPQCLVPSAQSLVLSLQSILVFFLIEALQSCKFTSYKFTSCKLESLQVNTLELGNGNWEFLFSIFCILFSVSRFPFLLFFFMRVNTFTH